LAVWWLRLGIQVERIEPGHPEQNGRHERMHRTLKESTTRPVGANLRAQQRMFDRFCQEYNHDRPHEALGQKPPATVYSASRRVYPSKLLSPEYDAQWQERAVRSNGEIRWKGDKWFISESLIGQRIGLKPVADGLWVIHFMSVELGVLNERGERIERRKWSALVKSSSTAPTSGAPGATT
jgi:hypothetical protein